MRRGLSFSLGYSRVYERFTWLFPGYSWLFLSYTLLDTPLV